MYNKIIFRLQKLVEITKFTFKFDKIFSFLKGIIEGLGFDVPQQILEACMEAEVSRTKLGIRPNS